MPAEFSVGVWLVGIAQGFYFLRISSGTGFKPHSDVKPPATERSQPAKKNRWNLVKPKIFEAAKNDATCFVSLPKLSS